MATILVLGVKVPFTTGGAEALVSTLMRELAKRGHEVDTVNIPFAVEPKEDLLRQAALWRALDLRKVGGRVVDLVIATKYPSYFIPHPRKSLWLVHQHRPVYDLFGGRYSDFSDDPRDEALRRLLVEADTTAIQECAYVSGISRTVVDRLKTFNRVSGEALYPPLPLGERYRTASSEEYFLSVGRLCAIKRVDLMIKALPFMHRTAKLKIVGLPDEAGILDYYNNEIAKHHLSDRVEFLGRVDDETLIDLYSRALGVYYAPHNEDYGYVTLEAFASSKPVITAHDSGGVLEFVRNGENGLIVDPTSAAIGGACNRLIEDRDFAAGLGSAGYKDIQVQGVGSGGWDRVCQQLLSPLATPSSSSVVPSVRRAGV